ncbi:MAG: flagellar hook-length control protein FliK [Pseudomonadota bacterium]
MQSLPISSVTPPTAAPEISGNNSANNAASASEVFGKVLQRQRASQPEAGNNSGDHKQAMPSQDSSGAASGADRIVVDIPAVPNAVGALPGDMLTMLKSDSDLDRPQPPAPDGVSTLPGDMLAMLLPPVAPAPAAAGAGATEAALAARPAAMLLRADGNAANALNAANTANSRPDPMSGVAINGIAGQAVDSIAPQAGNFSAVMEGISNDAAKAVQLNSQAQLASPDSTTMVNAAIHQSAQNAPLTPAPGATVQVAINTPVTDKAWGGEFNQKIIWLAGSGEHTAELHLNPPNLGPLDVVLRVSGDQATALFTSPHGVVRDAIEQALPKLREMLADNGIMLGNATVSDQSRQQSGLFGSDGQAGRNPSAGDHVDAGSGQSPSTTILPVRRHQGIVDTFA